MQVGDTSENGNTRFCERSPRVAKLPRMESTFLAASNSATAGSD